MVQGAFLAATEANLDFVQARLRHPMPEWSIWTPILVILFSPIVTLAVRRWRWTGLALAFGVYLAYEVRLITSGQPANIRVDLGLIYPALAIHGLGYLIWLGYRAKAAKQQ